VTPRLCPSVASACLAVLLGAGVWWVLVKMAAVVNAVLAGAVKL